MKETRLLMGMPITVHITDRATIEDIDSVYAFFEHIDTVFSTYKKDSEISRINAGLIRASQYSEEMRTVLQLAEQTKKETKGYFDIAHNGKLDPSGIVKGWAIWQAAEILKKKRYLNYFVDAGGDVQVSGKNEEGEYWRVGIRNPFERNQIIKAVRLKDCGIATSGTSIRGEHIYNPKVDILTNEIVSMTVIGPNIYEADRFATPAFAMGKDGIVFIEKLKGFEGYMVDKKGIATYTTGFEKYVV